MFNNSKTIGQLGKLGYLIADLTNQRDVSDLSVYLNSLFAVCYREIKYSMIFGA